MLRSETDYQELSRAYDYFFPEGDLEHMLALGQLQGLLVEMWSILNEVKDKNSERYKESKNRWLTMHKSIRLLDGMIGNNAMLRQKLIFSENELSRYVQLNETFEARDRNDNIVDQGISYPDW